MMIGGIYHIETCLKINKERLTTHTLHFDYKIGSF